MKVKHNINSSLIMSQMNALGIYFDRDGIILSSMGSHSIFGIKKDIAYKVFSDVLPRTLSNKIKADLNTLHLIKEPISSTINYSISTGKYIVVNITLDQQVVDEEIIYLMTFVKTNETSKYITEGIGYKSYEEAVNKLVKSEERYNSFFENDPVMHISADPNDGIIQECNLLTLSKLGYTRKDEVIGKCIFSIINDDENKSLANRLVKQFKETGVIHNEEIELETKDGSLIPVILYTTSQKNEFGEILFSRTTLVDISELKAAQEENKQKRAYLELLNKQLEQFVSTCSHDLQEPLATIKFAGDIISKLYGDKLDKKGKDYLSYIDEAVDRLSNQIRMLLDHAKIGNDAEKTVVDVDRLVKTVIKDLGKSRADANAKILVIEKLPKIKAYKTELRLLFQNLLSNAIKYKKENEKPQIIIQYNDFPECSEFLITDNGIGISKDDAKEIFKIFNKVNNSNPNKGSGIGLAHCEKIVKMHSGSIRVQSSIGSGSTFAFTIEK